MKHDHLHLDGDPPIPPRFQQACDRLNAFIADYISPLDPMTGDRLDELISDVIAAGVAAGIDQLFDRRPKQ